MLILFPSPGLCLLGELDRDVGPGAGHGLVLGRKASPHRPPPGTVKPAANEPSAQVVLVLSSQWSD